MKPDSIFSNSLSSQRGLRALVRKMLLLPLFAMSLGSCYKITGIHDAKKIDYPSATRSGVKYIPSKTDLSKSAWWKKLKDPQLNQLISQALLRNNNIKSSNATILQAQAQLKAAQYAWIPTLDATANGFTGEGWNSQLTSKQPQINNSFLANQSPTRFRGYVAGFVPAYTVNIMNNISNVKAAKASLAMQQAQAQATQLGIISQMSGAYFMLLSQREQLALEKALSRDLRKLRQLECVRNQKGASDLEAVMSIEQQLAQEEAKIPQIESIVAQSENTIQLLLNRNPGPMKTHRTLLSLNLKQAVPQNLPSSLLKNRPDIMMASNNVKMAYAQLGMAYSAFFPSISLTGFAGDVSVDLINLLKLSPSIWVAQALASSKILNASAYQNIKAAQASCYATYYDYLQTLRSAFADVDNNLTHGQKNRGSYAQTQKGYAAAKRAYVIALSQYKAGATDYRNAVNAKINLDRSRLTLIQAKAQLLDSLVQIYNAVAGGSDVA
ncbi:MAG: TolC family protein [Legionellales bacterium]